MSGQVLAIILTAMRAAMKILELIENAKKRGETTINISDLDDIFDERVLERMEEWDNTELGEAVVDEEDEEDSG